MGADYKRGLYKEYELVLTKKEQIERKYNLLQSQHRLLCNDFAREQALLDRERTLLNQERTLNATLQKEILRLTGIINIDGTNSGISTSKTPLSKKKVIPNSREKSGKKIGGQPGHPKSKLKAFTEQEVTEKETYKLDSCPLCGGSVVETGETIDKDELDYQVVVIKKRHQFSVCKCDECGKSSHKSIPPQLKEENQYGSHVRALGLSLMNIGNVSVNKVRKMIYGLSEEKINPTEGYLIKQQKKAANGLENFTEDLRKRCRQLSILYWDDTVIDINTRRGCLRFYGDEKLALYVAHQRKDKAGLDEDHILQLLPAETTVVHDHNRVNYNKSYSFRNVECNVHLLRDLQKTTDNLKHQWSFKLKELLSKTNVERNEALDREESTFTDEYVKEFFIKFDNIMLKAAEENQKDFSKYYGSDERTLILRILDYKDNYLAWVVNFTLPFSNNLSERALRGVKSKMKVAGQFQNEETAKYYAIVKSYIETCFRNGINETEALVRLCEGNPYTVAELFAPKSDV